MRIFQIEGSENSPWVWLDEKSGVLEISGNSSFRNPFQFYRSLAKWILAFNRGDHKTKLVNVRLIFIDEASVRGLEFIFLNLYKLAGDSEQLRINWYVPQGNQLIHKTGLQYHDQSKIPFKLIAC